MTGLTEEKKFSSEKNRWLMLPVLLVIATFIISLGYGFVSDDRIFLIDNPNFLSQPILKYFQHGVWKFSALDLPEGQLYRPMGLLLLRGVAELSGQNPFGYHLAQVLAHSIVTVLVFFLLASIVTDASGKALALATSVFAIHPIQVESVCWIGGIDVWTALFTFTAILLLFHVKDKRRIYILALSMIMVCAAMLSKETAYTLPGLLILLLFIREEAFGRKKIMYLAALSGIPLVIVFWLRKSAVEAPHFVYSVEGGKNLVMYFLGYLKMVVLPLPQRFYLSEPAGGSVATWEIVLGTLVLIGFVSLVLYIKEGRRLFLCSAGWYLLTLGPALAVAFHTARATFASRLLYLPSFALSLILLWLMTHGPAKRRKIIERGVVIVMMLFTVASMWTRSSWRDQGSFLEMAMSSTPDNIALNNNMGDYYSEIGKRDEAIESYRFVVTAALNKRHVNKRDKALAHERLGRIYAKAKSWDKARSEFEALLLIDPGNSSARNDLGNIAWLSGDLITAKKHYEMALLNDPENTIAQQNLSAVNRLLSKQ
ncbi:MAG: glycosyltransferase family 39 protein [Planctomycetota bacterium]|jgi:hypothetical protein